MAARSRTQRLEKIVAAGREDRRGDYRVLTVYRIARVSGASDSGLCRVQNVSDGGMMLVTALALAEEEEVEIALSDGVVLKGRVAWVDDAKVGVRFPEPIDVVTVLRSLAVERGAGAHRSIRLPVDTLAVASTPSGTVSIAVLDISQNGMKVRHDGSLEPELGITIALAGGLRRRAIVCWVRHRLAGLKLLDPIDLQELARASRL